MKELRIGTEASVSAVVSKDNTAEQMGSGSLPVFATPAVAALMEKAACEVLDEYLEDGITTVGTHISISHISPSPIGAQITASARLTETDGRRYVFEVSAYDNAGPIAKGTHERFSVKAESFMRKVESKLSE